MKSNISIIDALVQIKILQPNSYPVDEFYLKFKIRQTTPARIVDLTQLNYIAIILKLNLPDLAHNLCDLIIKLDADPINSTNNSLIKHSSL